MPASPAPGHAITLPDDGTGSAAVDVQQLQATASRWSQRSAELAALTPPAAGEPFQPITAAVGSVHVAVELAAAALTTRTQSTALAVMTGARRYGANEETAAAEMAAMRPRLV
ncbi:hypothetical protein [Mycobacterium szulgai]|uniref:hypothetical protein n=1 Tax=Mycobacterium szulgai TaxID=1787 RepID=UPI0035581FC2